MHNVLTRWLHHAGLTLPILVVRSPGLVVFLFIGLDETLKWKVRVWPSKWFPPQIESTRYTNSATF